MKAWVTKDKDGDVFLFWKDKPYKDEVTNAWTNKSVTCESLDEYSPFHDILDNLDPHWEDEEPIEVDITIKTD